MKVFHCDHCNHVVFFENVQCVRCKHPLAFLPDFRVMASLEKGEDGLWRSPFKKAEGRAYKLCENYSHEGICNWTVAEDDENPFCISCRLTRTIPDLSIAGNKERWFLLESAKRRLVYDLLSLGLTVVNKAEDPEHGLVYDLLADLLPPTNSAAAAAPATPVLTGHAEGVITINISEANDAERERRRLDLHEPYRTLLGHFRHEVGHYYWDRLVQDGGRVEEFRKVFGDESVDYAAALQKHYSAGPPADWQEHSVSAYCSSHAWEDWAETWAHYLHMRDVVETSAACGLSLSPSRKDEPHAKLIGDKPVDFDTMIDSFYPITYVLNNLNRCMGLHDAYPFVLSPTAVEKVRFVHETIVKGAQDAKAKRPAVREPAMAKRPESSRPVAAVAK